MIRKSILILFILLFVWSAAPANAGWFAEATFAPQPYFSRPTLSMGGNRRVRSFMGFRRAVPQKGYRQWSR